MIGHHYSTLQEAKNILRLLQDVAAEVSLPSTVIDVSRTVQFTANRHLPYFPIPFKETETAAALKAIEGSLASTIAQLRYGLSRPPQVTIDLEKAAAFLFQAYLATVGGYGKLDPGVKSFLKGRSTINARRRKIAR